jgi:hypothetical protein
MEIKITKREKLYEMNNEMCHNFYYLVHGRFYNDDKTAYRKFKFVVWFDIFDIDEYFNGDDGDEVYDIPITNNMIMEYLDECIWAMVNIVSDYNNENQLRYFYQHCNDSIRRYNEIAKYW